MSDIVERLRLAGRALQSPICYEAANAIETLRTLAGLDKSDVEFPASASVVGEGSAPTDTPCVVGASTTFSDGAGGGDAADREDAAGLELSADHLHPRHPRVFLCRGCCEWTSNRPAICDECCTIGGAS